MKTAMRRKATPREQFSKFPTDPDMLGMAWLCEMAACWREHVGDFRQAQQLFADASQLRNAVIR